MIKYISIILTILLLSIAGVSTYSVLQADVNRHSEEIEVVASRIRDLEIDGSKQSEQLKIIRIDITEIKQDVKVLLSR